ncbi:MAG: hypothetical protein KDB26_05625 [Microthrixaceae bacterium]|nr:hypothetical protein [Microthrixaceae bacterium]
MSPTPTPTPSPIVIDDEGFNQSTLQDALVQQAQIHDALTAGAPSVSVSCPQGTSMAKCAVTQAQLQARAEEMFSIPPHSGEFTTIGECPALKELPDSFPVHFIPAVCPNPVTTSTMTQAEFNALMDGQPQSNAAPVIAGVVLSVLVLVAAAVAFIKHRRANRTSPATAEATP